MTGNVPSTTLDDVNVTAKAATGTPATPSTIPYAKRVIQFTFQLAQGSFAGGGNTLTVSGVRASVHIERASTPAAESLQATIKGLTLDHINTLTKAGSTYFINQKNIVSISAGDVGGALTNIFTGYILYAYPDFSDQPDVTFVIQAYAALGLQLTPATPVSFNGPVSVEQALTRILKPAGVTVKNNGVSATLASPYFPGTVWQQALRLVKAANCYASYDSVAKMFTITSKTDPPSGQPVVFSPQTGMIGYPQFQNNFLNVRSQFAPGLITGVLTPIKVQSQLTAANGLWTALQVEYFLEAETPGGRWDMVVNAYSNSTATESSGNAPASS